MDKIIEEMHRMQPLKQEMEYDKRRGKMVPKGTVRGKTNPLPVLSTKDSWWNKSKRAEIPARAQYQLKQMGIIEFVSNRLIGQANRAAKRHAKNKIARKSRRANR